MAVTIPEPYLAAWRGFLNAHAEVLERIEEALAEAGLAPLSWYDVLWAIRSAPERTLRMGALSSRVVTISRTGLTRLVDRVEAAGLLGRQRQDTDRRGTWVVLTPEGEAMLRRMWPVYAAAIRRYVVDVLSDEEAAAIRDALERVSAAATAPRTPEAPHARDRVRRQRRSRGSGAPRGGRG